MTPSLGGRPFIEALSPSGRQAVLAAARRLRARRSEVLVQKDDRLSDVFLVLEGALRVYALTPQGREATLYRLRPGDICLLSLNAAFTSGRYPANVEVASELADIARIPGAVLRGLFRDEPAVQELVLGGLTSTINELMIQLDQALTASLRERLVGHLARIADPAGLVQATHQNLADDLGVTREAVSRELQILKAAGQATTSRGVVRLMRRERIDTAAAGGQE